MKVKTVSKTAAKTAAAPAKKAPAERPAPVLTLPKMLAEEAGKGTIDTEIFALNANADASVLMIALDELREMRRRIEAARKATDNYNTKHPGNKQPLEHFIKAKNYLETVIEKYRGIHAAKMRTDRLNVRLTWKMGAFSRLSELKSI